MIYYIKNKVEKILKSEIFNGTIQDICLQYLAKFNETDAYLTKIEQYIPKETDSDAFLLRMENRYFRMQEQLSNLATETDARLRQISDYYKYKA